MQEFDAIYRETHEEIYRFLLRLCLYNADLAEELTQETFFQAYRSIHRFEGRCHIKTWLCQIAKNTYYRSLRKDRPEDLRREAPAAARGVESKVEEQRAIRETLREINALAEPGRAILIYRLFFDMPYAQISSLLGISENSARVIFYRSKKEIQTVMREEYNDEC